MIGIILRMAARILTYLLFLTTILSAYGGFIPPKIWSVPSVAVLVFPYLLIASVVAALLWLLDQRLLTAICGGLTVLICWPVATAALPVSFSSKPTEPSFTLMTYNVYYLLNPLDDSSEGISPTLSYIIRQKPDMVCLQELEILPNSGVRKEQTDSLKKIYPYIVRGHAMADSYTPFLFMSRYPTREIEVPEDIEANCALYRVRLPGMTLHVLNIHLTSYKLIGKQRTVVSDIRGLRSARESLKLEKGIYAKLSEAFRLRQDISLQIRKLINSIEGPLVVCGDFNDVPGSWAYRTIRGKDLKDAVAKTSLGPTVTYNANALWFDIDQILYRPGELTPHKTVKGKLKSSDHYPLTETFSYQPSK